MWRAESRGQSRGPSRDETERCVESLVFPVFQIRRGTLRPKQELVPWKSCDDEEDAYDDEHLAHCEFPEDNLLGGPRDGKVCQERESSKGDEPPANLLPLGFSHLLLPPRAAVAAEVHGGPRSASPRDVPGQMNPLEMLAILVAATPV